MWIFIDIDFCPLSLSAFWIRWWIRILAEIPEKVIAGNLEGYSKRWSWIWVIIMIELLTTRFVCVSEVGSSQFDSIDGNNWSCTPIGSHLTSLFNDSLFVQPQAIQIPSFCSPFLHFFAGKRTSSDIWGGSLRPLNFVNVPWNRKAIIWDFTPRMGSKSSGLITDICDNRTITFGWQQSSSVWWIEVDCVTGGNSYTDQSTKSWYESSIRSFDDMVRT
jgi:hypothetical protein